MINSKLTIITPTIGRNSLSELIDSIQLNNINNEIIHLILWDSKNGGDQYVEPRHIENYIANKGYKNVYNIFIPDDVGKYWGSGLRAIGLLSATTEYVTFADDDIILKDNYYKNIKDNIIDKNYDWGGWRRDIFNPLNGEFIGTDNFESVGDSNDRKVPYEFLDNSCMIFKRQFGVYASPIYRESTTYSDDREMYKYLKDCSDNYIFLNVPLVNHKCPEKLILFFEENCTNTKPI